MNYNFEVKINVLIGATIEEVANEMVSLANRLLCLVSTDFNGVHLIAGPGQTPDNIVKSFHADLRCGKCSCTCHQKKGDHI